MQRPMYITIGSPCTHYCLGGDKTGQHSLTGWQFTDAPLVILAIQPLCFRLEQSGNADNVNNGEEVNQVIEQLSKLYTVYKSVVQTWVHGDQPHRSRLFIVGFHKNMAHKSGAFIWPAGLDVSEQKKYTARDIALPDNCIPRHLWRRDNTTRIPSDPKHKYPVRKLAYSGEGMGPPNNPHSVTSWDSVSAGPTTLSGVIRRIKLCWIDRVNNPVGPTRLNHFTELGRMMSQPYDVSEWYSQFVSSTSDNFSNVVSHNLGNGISTRMYFNIDTAV